MSLQCHFVQSTTVKTMPQAMNDAGGESAKLTPSSSRSAYGVSMLSRQERAPALRSLIVIGLLKLGRPPHFVAEVAKIRKTSVAKKEKSRVTLIARRATHPAANLGWLYPARESRFPFVTWSTLLTCASKVMLGEKTTP